MQPISPFPHSPRPDVPPAVQFAQIVAAELFRSFQESSIPEPMKPVRVIRNRLEGEQEEQTTLVQLVAELVDQLDEANEYTAEMLDARKKRRRRR